MAAHTTAVSPATLSASAARSPPALRPCDDRNASAPRRATYLYRGGHVEVKATRRDSKGYEKGPVRVMGMRAVPKGGRLGPQLFLAHLEDAVGVDDWLGLLLCHRAGCDHLLHMRGNGPRAPGVAKGGVGGTAVEVLQ
jgi:hypothetical protein